MSKKELHLAQNFDDLEKLHVVDDSLIHKASISQLLQTIVKLVKKAEKYRLEGDEESYYVLCMKYMNIVSKLQNAKDYEKQKLLVSEVLGTNGTQSAFLDRLKHDLFEAKNSLMKRFDKSAKTVEPRVLPKVNVNKCDYSWFWLPSKENVITCDTLFNMMEEGTQLLIFDIRPEEHYKASKMKYRYTLNVPEELCNIGMTASKIQKQMPNESKVFWELRKKRPYIVLVDWVSQMFLRNSPVWHLKEILLLFDDDVDKKPEILLVEGGYNKWKTNYPEKCINPQYPLPSNINIPSANPDEVEYPNIEDIPMKGDLTMTHSAIKTNESEKTQLQLLEENKTIIHKSVQNEKELLSLEHQYKNIVTDKEINEDSAATAQIYLYKIYELEEKHFEIKADEKTLEEQLKHRKDRVKEPLQDARILAKIKEAERRILQMQFELKQLEEKRKIMKEFREAALKLSELIQSPKSLNNRFVASAFLRPLRHNETQ